MKKFIKSTLLITLALCFTFPIMASESFAEGDYYFSYSEEFLLQELETAHNEYCNEYGYTDYLDYLSLLLSGEYIIPRSTKLADDMQMYALVIAQQVVIEEDFTDEEYQLALEFELQAAQNAKLRAYSSSSAVTYASKYYNTKNPIYAKFSSNCCNFVSQCLKAGGYAFDGTNTPLSAGYKIVTSTSEWYHVNKFMDHNPHTTGYGYVLTSSFSSIADFKVYWSNKYVGDYNNDTAGNNNLYNNCKVGDVILLKNSSGGNYHAVIVVKKANNKVYCASNTTDRWEYDYSQASGVYGYSLYGF